jgi:Ca-activated chloride channel family protein
MDGLRFASPYLLLLLLALPAVGLLAYRRREETTPPVAFGSAAAASAATRSWKLRLEPALLLLRLVAAALLVVALARPQRGEAESAIEGEGVDIVLAFDVSSSMTQPFAGIESRLDAATRVLAEFVSSRTEDRVGLVVFKRSSLTMSPLTTDYSAVRAAVENADTIELGDGTAIGVAIGESVNVLRESKASSRIVILLTDGENNVEEVQPLSAARIAERLGVRVYTVGVVSRGLDRSQSTLNVDERALTEIAEITQGTYNRAEDPTALAQIYQSIDELERSRVEGRTFTRFDEFAPYVLAAAAILLATEVVLRYSLFRRAW